MTGPDELKIHKISPTSLEGPKSFSKGICSKLLKEMVIDTVNAGNKASQTISGSTRLGLKNRIWMDLHKYSGGMNKCAKLIESMFDLLRT